MSEDTERRRIQRLRLGSHLKRNADGAPLLSPLFVLHQGTGIHVVDIRPAEEACGALGYIPGSTFVSIDRLKPFVQQVHDDLPVVLVSRKGDKAAAAALRLEQSGLDFVAAMDGGLADWRLLGFDTSRDPHGVADRVRSEEQTDRFEGPFSLEQVRNHVGEPRNIRWVKFGSLTKYGGFSCIDGRDERGLIGTPGGDAGEFLLSLAALESVAGVRLDEDSVARILLGRVDIFGTLSMHTDAQTFRGFLDALGDDPRIGNATERSEGEWFELLQRPPVELREAILEHVVNPHHLGCGHVRLMLEKPDEYGIRSELVTFFIRAFHRLWWEGAPELGLTVLPGRHEEAAVINVRLEDDLWSLSSIPLIAPTSAGRQVFVNHPDVATHLRRGVVEFFCRGLGSVAVDDGETFQARLHELATQQITQTIGYLAKGLPIFDVVFSRDGSFEVGES